MSNKQATIDALILKSKDKSLTIHERRVSRDMADKLIAKNRKPKPQQSKPQVQAYAVVIPNPALRHPEYADLHRMLMRSDVCRFNNSGNIWTITDAKIHRNVSMMVALMTNQQIDKERKLRVSNAIKEKMAQRKMERAARIDFYIKLFSGIMLISAVLAILAG